MIKNFSIGSDFELFLKNDDGKIINAETIIPGSKYEPMVVDNWRTISYDNILAEATINPVTTEEQYIEEMTFMLKYLAEYVRPHGLSLDIYPARMVDDDQLQTENAKTLGCEEDFNVYDQAVNPKPLATTGLRTAGAHFHIVWDNFTVEDGIELIKACDVFMAIPMMLIEPETKRRQLYGKAGCIRFIKHNGQHGMEYRTLSGYIADSEELLRFVWRGLMQAIDFINSGKVIEDFEDVRSAINNNDVELAKTIQHKYEKQVQLAHSDLR